MVVYTLEQRWEVGLLSTYRRYRFWQKKITFSDKAHIDFGGYVNKQNCHIWGTEIPHADIEKPTHPKRVTVWCGFRSRGQKLLLENKQREAITVNGDRYRANLKEFLFTKIEKEDIGNIGLFLKILLSAAELMSFRLLGAAIKHRWAIICGVPSKISVTLTSQRQLTL